jgi:hypothetical protein
MKQVKDIIWLRDKSDYIQNNPVNISKTKELLDSTGKGFCLAKFTQVTMHLGTGMTHACHHPSPHKIPLTEIENNPAALFNTQHLKKARSEMMNGERPAECDYCWRVEDNNGPSDRFFKSLEPWALDKHDEIQKSDPNENYYPTYLEVDFSNVCNFKCTYCGPEYSSKWVEDLKKHGPLKLLEGTVHSQWAQGYQKNLDSLNYKNSEFNPYTDAFWKWFPEAYKHLKVYRITGGEPLLAKETFRSMDWFIENPNRELEFSINSNLGAPDALWNQFIEKVKIIANGNYVKKFTVFTSVDGWGKRAEYIRPGLNFEVFKQRYEQLLQINNVRATIMCTFNILSVTSIKELFKWQVELKRKYNNNNQGADWENELGFKFSDVGDSFTERKNKNPDHFATVGLDTPYLRSPAFLDAQYITDDIIQQYLLPAMNYVAENTATHSWNSHQGFEDYELEKFKRICLQIMGQATRNRTMGNSVDTIVNRAKLYEFVNEIDRRHGTDFLDTFPELEEFYKLCKKMNDEVREGNV